MLRAILITGAGGFLGSISRYLTQIWIENLITKSFPYAILSVNVVGSFIIGVVYALSERGNLISPEMRIFLAIGFCGSFTTFSSFSHNNITLLKDNQLFQMFSYMALSIVLGMLATFGGIILGRNIGK